jgi:nucleoside-diphosphate-sugar epimerase
VTGSPDDLAGQRILVTGAAGFIGSHLVERLRALGAEVHGLSRLPRTTGTIRWWTADIGDTLEVRRVVSAVKPSVVFNLAGETRAARDVELVRPTVDTNLLGTVNVLLAALEAGCRRVVLTGSLEEPEAAGNPVPSSPYAASKWAGQAYAQMFHDLYGLPVVSLRVFMVYGPGQRDLQKLVPYTILSLLQGRPPELSSGGREIDWVYVEDVADAFVASATAQGLEGATIDVGSGSLVSVREIVERLTRMVDAEITPQFGAVADRPAERVRAADTEVAAARLGWRAATELDEGLRRTIEWYRASR